MLKKALFLGLVSLLIGGGALFAVGNDTQTLEKLSQIDSNIGTIKEKMIAFMQETKDKFKIIEQQMPRLATMLLFLFVLSGVGHAIGNDQYTKLLLHFNGDVSSANPAGCKVVSLNGTPAFVANMPATGNSAFGGSMYFNGSGAYLNVGASNDFNFGSGDFTIDTWVKFNQTGSIAIIAGPNNVSNPPSDGGWWIEVNRSCTGLCWCQRMTPTPAKCG
jgi:hypothetical protein